MNAVTNSVPNSARKRTRPRSLGDVSGMAMLAFQVAFGLLFLFVWHLASGTVISDFYVSHPLTVGRRLAEWILDGTLIRHAWATTYATVLGFLIGSVIGCVLGFWLGLSEFTSRLLNPFLLFFYALPKPALAPLFILWFGFGAGSKVALASLLVFFLVFYNTYTGVREVDRDLVDTARLMKASRWQIVFKVIIPATTSWVFAGLQISVPFALIGAIVGEMLASNQGLGYLIHLAGAEFDTAAVFAGLIAIAFLGIVLNKLIDISKAGVQPWKAISK